MTQVSIARPETHLGIAGRFPEITHPLSRLGKPETVSFHGVSRLSVRESVAGTSPPTKRLSESASGGRKELASGNAYPEFGKGDLDDWRKVDRWINLKKCWAGGPRISDEDDETVVLSRPGTQMRLQVDELEYLLRQKIKAGGFYALRQLFRANDINGRGHVTREVLLIILTRFLRRFITAKLFYHLLLRLKLNEKPIITHEDFYVYFKEREPKGYPVWMDSIKGPQADKKMSATRAHLRLKAMVRESPRQLKALFAEMENGKMLPLEFQSVLQSFGVEMDHEEFMKLLKRYDPNNLGTVQAQVLKRALGFLPGMEYREGWMSILSASGRGTRGSSRRSQTKAERERKLTLDIENWLKEKFREGFKRMMGEFHSFDQDNSRTVTREHFINVLARFNLPLREEQLDIFLVRCGLQEGARLVNYVEFLQRFQDRSDRGMPHKILTKANHRYNKLRSVGPQSTITALETKLINLFQSDFLSLLETFQKLDNQRLDVVRQQVFWTILKSRFGIHMSDEEMSCLIERMPLDAQGNVKYLELMAMFDSSNTAKSLLGDKSIMTHLSKALPDGNSLRTFASESIEKGHGSKRTNEQITKMIQDFLKKNYQVVGEAFTELDGMNTKRLTPESMYQLLKNFDIRPFVSRAEVGKLWSTLCTSQDSTLDFHEFVRHFRFSPKTACFPNARLQPPLKGDSDFLLRSRKFNCDTEMLEDNLRAKVLFSLEQLWKHFRELDQFNTGFVSKEEFQDVLTDLCGALNERECETIINKFDRGENRISYIEFLRPFEERRQSPRLGNLKKRKAKPLPTVYTESVHNGLNIITGKLRQKLAGNWKILRGACEKMDCSNAGYLSLPEFRCVLRLCNVILEEDEIYHVVSKCDEDTIGRIDYSKLISKLFRGTQTSVVEL